MSSRSDAPILAGRRGRAVGEPYLPTEPVRRPLGAFRHALPATAMSPVARRLSALAALSDEELDLLLGLGRQIETCPPRVELVAEGRPPARPRLVVSGWACQQRILSDGRRQIFAFILPGDAVGLSPPGPFTFSSTVALTAMECVDATPLRRIIADSPQGATGLADAFQKADKLHQARLLDHLIRLGRLSAHERVAHLLVDLHDRLAAVGLADGATFPMPLTQETLADALGLSVVHVNRILQQLRRENLVEMRGGRATLLEPELLARLCDYHPAEA